MEQVEQGHVQVRGEQVGTFVQGVAEVGFGGEQAPGHAGVLGALPGVEEGGDLPSGGPDGLRGAVGDLAEAGGQFGAAGAVDGRGPALGGAPGVHGAGEVSRVGARGGGEVTGVGGGEFAYRPLVRPRHPHQVTVLHHHRTTL
ncbi:hypothetical protein ACWG44_30750, partial [Streptomyces albidoflavus]